MISLNEAYYVLVEFLCHFPLYITSAINTIFCLLLCYTMFGDGGEDRNKYIVWGKEQNLIG